MGEESFDCGNELQFGNPFATKNKTFLVYTKIIK